MTVNNSNPKRRYDNTMPTTDEGWWQSVLAEERLHAPVRPQQVVKPKPIPEAKVEQSQEPPAMQDRQDLRDRGQDRCGAGMQRPPAHCGSCQGGGH